MGCCASADSTHVVKSAYLKTGSSSKSGAGGHGGDGRGGGGNGVGPVSNDALNPSSEYHAHLHHSTQKSSSTPDLHSNRYAIQLGSLGSYYDLDAAESKRPGWSDDSDGPAYTIFLERELAMHFLARLQEHPAIGRLPLQCVGGIGRTEYRGQEVVSFRITNPDGNRCAIFDCAKLLRTTGPTEFRHVLAYYGEDPIHPMTSREEDTRRNQRLTFTP